MPLRMSGKDKFGSFTITNSPTQSCSHCKNGGPCVKYKPSTFELPNGIELSNKLILSSTEGRLCILNGCYGAFHRQVAHIVDAYGRQETKRSG